MQAQPNHVQPAVLIVSHKVKNTQKKENLSNYFFR